MGILLKVFQPFCKVSKDPGNREPCLSQFALHVLRHVNNGTTGGLPERTEFLSNVFQSLSQGGIRTTCIGHGDQPLQHLERNRQDGNANLPKGLNQANACTGGCLEHVGGELQALYESVNRGGCYGEPLHLLGKGIHPLACSLLLLKGLLEG